MNCARISKNVSDFISNLVLELINRQSFSLKIFSEQNRQLVQTDCLLVTGTRSKTEKHGRFHIQGTRKSFDLADGNSVI